MKKIKKKEKRFCCLCGKYEEMTFEHIPPRGVGNKNRIRQTFIISNKKHVQQKGSGFNSLCKKCNNYLGRHYASRYKMFSEKALGTQSYESGNKVFKESIEIYPLEVLKQVVSMFLSFVSISSFFSNSNEKEIEKKLQNFVLETESSEFPAEVEIGMYFQHSESKMNRLISISSLGYRDRENGMMDILAYSELVANGIGYILFLKKKENSLERINEEWKDLQLISNFKDFLPEKLRKVEIKTKIFKVNNPFPLDFREETMEIPPEFKDHLLCSVENYNVIMSNRINSRYFYGFNRSECQVAYTKI